MQGTIKLGACGEVTGSLAHVKVYQISNSCEQQIKTLTEKEV